MVPRALICAVIALALAACDRAPPKPKVGLVGAAAMHDGARDLPRPQALFEYANPAIAGVA
jgi:hypothetical protein